MGRWPKSLHDLHQKILDECSPQGECLIWQKNPDRRTGIIASKWVNGGKVTYVHRAVWEAVNGPLPTGSQVHHTCGEPRCCNISHLELVSFTEHQMIHKSETCPRGHNPSEFRYLANGHRWCPSCDRELARERYRDPEKRKKKLESNQKYRNRLRQQSL